MKVIQKTTFEEIVHSEIEKIENNRNDEENYTFLVDEFYELLLARGFYAKQLEFWFKKFPRKNVLLISSEELATNTDKTISEIFEFLEVPVQKISDLTKQNERKYPKMKDSTRDTLINFFKPYNEKLYSLVNQHFDWDK